jgi:chromosome segregation protein
MSDTVRAALSESMTRQQEVRNRITALSSDDHSIKLREWRSEMAMGKKAFEQARGVVIAHEKRLEELGKENNNKSSALTAAKQIHSTSEAARDSALDKLQQSSPEHLRQRLHEAQHQRVEAEGMRAKAIIILESGEDKSRLLQDMVDRLTGKADDIQSSIAARVASIKTWTASIETDGKELTERESERAVIMEEHEGLEDERMRSTEERAGLRASYSQKANDAQNRRRLAEEITRSVANKQNELIELATEMAEMAIAIADPEVELPSVGDAEKRLRALERRLEAYGPVNMLAIEQYGECEERLSSMKDDFKTLQQRRKQLITITDKLEGQRKSRLLAVLKEVNENFKKVYNQLSDGGRGELFLEDPANPFKGGLDMWAQPRGKSSKSRLQGLSGGEQSMAALALIFAIQDHDPSPFYYFDEVDQNLDAYNAGLIAKMCRERSEAAQFIMVTLRKVSLRLADHHIGITHGGDGCSRRIVDFDRERAITLGEAALKEAKEAADVNHSRIEEASNQAKDMPKVPEALAAPSSLGNLLNHIAQEVVADESEAAVDTNFSSIVERTEDLTEDITERREIVEALLEAASEEEEITSADEEQIGIEEEV